MTDPLTPPTELVHKWALEAEDEHQPTVAYSLVGQLAAKAAQWGSDQELEACVAWLEQLEPPREFLAMQLRAARRTKPPSLKEQALAELEILSDYAHGLGCSESAIRRALEALDD